MFLHLVTVHDALTHYADHLRAAGDHERARSAERIAARLPRLRALLHNAARLCRLGAVFNQEALDGLDFFTT